jgi:hypothetical protein
MPRVVPMWYVDPVAKRVTAREVIREFLVRQHNESESGDAFFERFAAGEGQRASKSMFEEGRNVTLEQLDRFMRTAKSGAIEATASTLFSSLVEIAKQLEGDTPPSQPAKRSRGRKPREKSSASIVVLPEQSQAPRKTTSPSPADAPRPGENRLPSPSSKSSSSPRR